MATNARDVSKAFATRGPEVGGNVLRQLLETAIAGVGVVPGAKATAASHLVRRNSVEEAIDHVNEYGSGHSEAIVTNDRSAARAFQLGIDSACIYVNASTRFTDGGEFGMGAKIGNSTQKLHARGPIGLRELCSTRYLVEGDGQVRA